LYLLRRHRSGGLQFEASAGKKFMRHYLEKTNKKSLHKKIGLMEWLKMKTLSSSPSTTKNKQIKKNPPFLKQCDLTVVFKEAEKNFRSMSGVMTCQRAWALGVREGFEAWFLLFLVV
jgi:hypothetical protein